MNSSTKITIALLTVLGSICVAAAIALAVYFTWPQETSGQANLVGGFTIQEKTPAQVSNSSICSYLEAAVLSGGVTTSSCEILAKRQGSVKVKYRLAISMTSANQSYVLNQASSAIALFSSKSSIFKIDQRSITFEDEKGESSVYCQPTRSYIPPEKICDRYQDCPDDSDEINCPCDHTYQYGCTNGRCIYKDWLCDGVKDCPQGDDEIYPQCKECNVTQFRCEKPRACIDSSLQCDGKVDCADSSDENNCLHFRTTFPSLLNVTYQGSSGYYICSKDWTRTWSDRVCLEMGYGNSTSTSPVSISSGSFLQLSPTSSSNVIASLQTSIHCNPHSAVSIGCAPSGCGTRSASAVNVGPYIINGQRAAMGAWPWQVIVRTGIYRGTHFYGETICGGILLNSRWILTAGHCTQIDRAGYGYYGTTRPENLQIIIGTISLDDPKITSRADRVFTHPEYVVQTLNNDVGLIRLSQPITFSDTVRPICLPEPSEDLRKFKVCVNTGFGWTLRNDMSSDLLQARMNVMADEDCFHENPYYRNTTQICVGTTPTTGDINICSGDSGGPLSCQDSNGFWKVIGVNSYGLGLEDGSAVNRCRLSVVARVTAFVDWIRATI